jgi:FkbM family methyltransferase
MNLNAIKKCLTSYLSKTKAEGEDYASFSDSRWCMKKSSLDFFDHLFASHDSIKRIVLVGGYRGDTTSEYLAIFPKSQIDVYEPDIKNVEELQSRFAENSRVRISSYAVGNYSGEVKINFFSDSATNSIFLPRKMELWDADVSLLSEVAVPQTTLDNEYWTSAKKKKFDLLHMDIQGGELAALKGATKLLQNKLIGVLRLEVEFEEIYSGQPLIWDIGKYLDMHDYRLAFFSDLKTRDSFPPKLVWADAFFVPRSENI